MQYSPPPRRGLTVFPFGWGVVALQRAESVKSHASFFITARQGLGGTKNHINVMFTNKTAAIAVLLMTALCLMPSCSKDDSLSDPCARVTCLNGGTCANGSCNCPTGFTGSDCGTARIPSRVIITKIVVTRYPATFETNAPDLRPKMSLNSTQIWESDQYVDDAVSGFEYEFVTNISLSSPTSQYALELWDYDPFDPDDFMGGVLFYPISGNSRPSTRNIDAGGNVAFRINLSYVY